MKKKILALCLVVVLAVTAVTGATLAYFTDNAEVTNAFTVGEIDIKLEESDLDKDGITEEGNQYDDIYPGAVLVKDPTVTVLADSEDCFVRMKVTVDTEKLAKAFANYTDDYYATEDGESVFLLQKLVDWNEDAWAYEGYADGTYEFRYVGKEADAKGIIAEPAADLELEPLFTQVTIPTELKNAELAELEDIEIDIIAEAMQAAKGNDTFTADEAWDAFDAA